MNFDGWARLLAKDLFLIFELLWSMLNALDTLLLI